MRAKAGGRRASGYISDRIAILDMLEPTIIFIISILQPRTPFLAIAALILARCLYIFHLCGQSAMALIIVVIFDMSPEHDIIVADAGLDIQAAQVMTDATIAYFIMNLLILAFGTSVLISKRYAFARLSL